MDIPMKSVCRIANAAKESVVEGVSKFIEVARVYRASFGYCRCCCIIKRHTLGYGVFFDDGNLASNITVNVYVSSRILVFR